MPGSGSPRPAACARAFASSISRPHNVPAANCFGRSAVDLLIGDRQDFRKTIETVTLSSKYQLVLPRGVRERLQLHPGRRITVLEKDGVILLVPERPLGTYRGIVRGVSAKGLREKKDRL